MSLESSGLYHYQSLVSDPTTDFNTYFDRCKTSGTLGEPSDIPDETKLYLPKDALDQYFTVEKIDILCRRLYDGRGFNVIQAQVVKDDYVQIFATLLHIGRPDLLQLFLTDPDLKDTHLPFRQKPVGFPRDPGLFEYFYDAQWRFCAPIVQNLHGTEWSSRQILPFRCLKKLGEGNDGKAYLIEIHPAHDRIPDDAPSNVAGPSADTRPSDAKSTSAANRRHYVLKVLRPARQKSKQQWKKEAMAHVSVRINEELRKDDGIVRYYGCFSQGQTFSILLEYAPLGNLEQLFRNGQVPVNMEDVLDLWRSFMQLLQTLHCLRNMQYKDGTSYQMCHFDIKPQNILLFPSPSDRPYAIRFKLGDLGSSVHTALIDEHEAYAKQSPGTRTYGAPECCRSDPMSDVNLPLNYVSPPADLWSLGCIASELATWIMRGWGALQQYRDTRRYCHNDPTFKDSDCFHNGDETLPMVFRHHERLQEDSPAENATVVIIPIIDEDILLPDPSLRKDPRTLYQKIGKALNGVKKLLSSIPIIKEEQQTRNHLMHREAVVLPVRPNVATQSSVQPLRRAEKAVQRETRDSNAAIDGEEFNLPNTPTRPARYRSISASQHIRANPQRATVSQGSRTSVPNFMPPGYEYGQNVRPARLSPPFASAGRRPHASSSEGQRRSHRMSSGHGQDYQGPTTPPQRSPKSTETMLYDERGLSHEPESYDSRDEDWSHAWQRDAKLKEQWLHPEEVLESPMEEEEEAEPVKTSSSGKQLPVMTVDEAIAWRDATKQPSRLSKLFNRRTRDDNPRWSHLTKEFVEKDFVLLVDDSPSMRPHWKYVKECAGLFAFCTTPYDDDGIELRYTMSEERKRTKDTTTIFESVEKNKPNPQQTGVSNMHAALTKVLSKYKDKVEDKYGSGKRPPQKFKGLILYILTDGGWDECDAKEPIRELVEVLKACERPSNLVGIQFIQFGNDKEGHQRLVELDDFMRKRDIVDLEPYRGGNFIKMLVGSINKAYDNLDHRISLSDQSESSLNMESPGISQRASGSHLPHQSPPLSSKHHRQTSKTYGLANGGLSQPQPRQPPPRKGTNEERGTSHLRGGSDHYRHFPYGHNYCG